MSDVALPQNEEPSTPEGWAALERERQQVIIRSDVWAPLTDDGPWTYEVRHPASSRREIGEAGSHDEAYEEIDRVVREWIGRPPECTAQRVHFEEMP
jgi:hypothetical protein